MPTGRSAALQGLKFTDVLEGNDVLEGSDVLEYDNVLEGNGVLEGSDVLAGREGRRRAGEPSRSGRNPGAASEPAWWEQGGQHGGAAVLGSRASA